jgi:hypothetical protein
MAVYICDVIGDGTAENAYRPAIADYAVAWSAIDGRADATSPIGSMLVFCTPDPLEAELIAADPRIERID